MTVTGQKNRFAREKSIGTIANSTWAENEILYELNTLISLKFFLADYYNLVFKKPMKLWILQVLSRQIGILELFVKRISKCSYF